MDRQADGRSNGQTDGIIGGQTNEWIDMQYMCIDMQKKDVFLIDFAIFTKALRTNRRTDGPTDQPTDRPTDEAAFRVACTRLIT